MKCLTENKIKYIVILSMVIDHIAWRFVPEMTAAWFIMHFFGRLAGPTMAYFLTEGFVHTHNVRKYAARLSVFALISWAPYSLYLYGRWPSLHMSVIYTLLTGLFVLIVQADHCLSLPLKGFVTVALLAVSCLGDWPFLDAAWPLIFYLYRKDEKKKWLLFSLLALTTLLPDPGTPFRAVLYNLGIFLVPVLLHFFYNGKRGSRHPFHKWFFYIFYPAQFLVLYLIATGKCAIL